MRRLVCAGCGTVRETEEAAEACFATHPCLWCGGPVTVRDLVILPGQNMPWCGCRPPDED